MIRFFWKYRLFNLFVIFFCVILCLLNLKSINIFFDSERIIELANVEQDVIDRSLDDTNLLLVGIELQDSLSFTKLLNIDTIIDEIQSSQHVKSIRSILNEQVVINQAIPFPLKLLKYHDENNFINSINTIHKYNSNYITSNLKNLVFVIKCKNLESEYDKIFFLNYLENNFSKISAAQVNITGQIKSEIYMKKNIINELIFFVTISTIICSLILFYFFRNYKIVLVCLLSIFVSILFSFSISNFLFGGIELVMIIIPAIIFIINISDYMHLLNLRKGITNGYDLFCEQIKNIGKPVFLTSLTTAIGFLSFTFGSFEPLMRFGVVTTLSIFICLFIIITFFSFIIDFNIFPQKNHFISTTNIHRWINKTKLYKKWIIVFFLALCSLNFFNFKIDNFLTSELNRTSVLFQEINFIEQKFGGIKPLSFSLIHPIQENIGDFVDFLESKNISVDIVFNKKDTVLLKTRSKDIGAYTSNIIYEDIQNFSKKNNINSKIGGVGYLFDKISNDLTLEVLFGLLIAVLLVGLIFVLLNNFNFSYLPISLIPNLLPLFSCLGLFSLFGFYLSLSNAFIFAIAFGLIVDDSIHIISSYSINRKNNKSISESIMYCRNKTFHAVVKTTILIIITLLPLLFSEFRSISQLASITIISAIFAIIFDLLFLPDLLKKYIK